MEAKTGKVRISITCDPDTDQMTIMARNGQGYLDMSDIENICNLAGLFGKMSVRLVMKANDLRVKREKEKGEEPSDEREEEKKREEEHS